MIEGDDRAGLAWLEQFERQRGRKLRVLHIGNIANNAYNNAKIQRRRGIEADVSCHDYFHIMGCPEWEDAEFTGDVVDPFFPDWWNVDLHGFERPEWFAQGGWRASVRYLLARRQGRVEQARLHRRVLTAQRWLRCRSTPTARAFRKLAFDPAWFLVPFQVLGRRLAALPRTAGAIARREHWHVVAGAFLPARLLPRSVTAGLPVSESTELALHARSWKPLLDEYDVVQAYSTDGAIPLFAGTGAWAAYEHGTLREIPFLNTPTGRLCALTYREAPAVFVTNSDVLPSVERLGLDPRRVVHLPHAVDSDRLFAFADADARDPEPGPPAFFSPTRQDWVDGDVSWSKGNDLLIRAAASLRDREFRLVLAGWGRDLEASRALVEELGLADRIEWIQPLRKHDLWTRYLSSHAVVDQFTLPAIGGVAFEAMALGRRVITALDLDQTNRFFGSVPPLLAAQTEDEIANALARVLDDPGDEAGLGADARAWFAERHSADRIVDLQARAYRRLIEGAHA